ncbi:MAG: RHS repeat protein [Gammaproteobacteria bacterium]|nr:RHS repeat protein [Gammaproteobacteria bacterium]
MKTAELLKKAVIVVKIFCLLVVFGYSQISFSAEQVSPIPAYWKWGQMAATAPNVSHVYDAFEQIRDHVIGEVSSLHPSYEVRWEPREFITYPSGSDYRWSCGSCTLYTYQISATTGLVFFEEKNPPGALYEYAMRVQDYLQYAPICPIGYIRRAGPISLPTLERYTCQAPNTSTPVPEKNPKACPSEGLVGNPINLSLNAKYQSETDYESGPASQLKFKRQYISDGIIRRVPSIGKNWWHNYDRRIVLNESYVGQAAYAYRADGRMLWFVLRDGIWVADSDINDRLDQLTDAEGNVTGWRYFNASNNETEIYDVTGKLLSIVAQGGQVQTMTYSTSDTPDTIAKFENFLIEVTDHFGRTLQFTYNEKLLVASMTDPAGGVYAYEYDNSDRLISVTHPDTSSRIYHYENSKCKEALTGITDENGVRFATFEYDTSCRVTSTEHAGGVDHYSVSYGTNSATVIDPLGSIRNYDFTTVLGVVKNTNVSQPCPSCGSNTTQSRSYDANGNVAQRVDFNGNTTNYQYNSRNQEISRTEAAGSIDERIITTEWHPVLSLPVRIQKPGQAIEMAYDEAGNMLLRREIDTTGNCGIDSNQPECTRETAYSYNDDGLLESVDGPRTDIVDITRYTYDAFGNRIGITNALGQMTQITSHDAHGNPLSIVNVNGVEISLAYDSRQRLLSRAVAAGTADEAVTAFEYDSVGNLTRITQANGSWLAYEYDAAHRMVAVTDSIGNRIEYILDNAGNRVQQQTIDPYGVLVQTQSALFSELGRLSQQLGASGQAISYTYDHNGNLISTIDPAGSETMQSFDALNRLIRTIDPINGAVAPTEYQYDSQGNLGVITDAEGLTTTYIYNGFGEAISQTSPNTGTTTYSYDSTGNRSSQTDAKGVLVNYSYDALNRLTDIQYPNSDENVRYIYDSSPHHGVGRLAEIRDQSSRTGYDYDLHGNIVEETHNIVSEGQTIPFVTRYSYDIDGNIIQITYPGGRQLDYVRNENGQITEVNTTVDEVTTVLATNIQYQPFALHSEFTYGNGLEMSQRYDLDRRLLESNNGVQSLNYSYDLNSNINQITDLMTTGQAQSFDYDLLDRLINADGSYGFREYSYDGVGNRLRLNVDTVLSNYIYIDQTQQLQSISGGMSRVYSYDEVGNTVQRDSDRFVYNDANRLSQITISGQVNNYLYNALGQRTLKQVSNTSTVFIYDLLGNLIAEADAQGNTQVEYIYLNGERLAMLIAGRQVDSEPDKPKSTKWFRMLKIWCKKEFIKIMLKVKIFDFLLDKEDRKTITKTKTRIYESCDTFDDTDYKDYRKHSRNKAWKKKEKGKEKCKPTGGQQTTIEPAIYYYHNDHLGTPQKMTDENQQVVWSAVYTPFGQATVNQDPDGDGIELVNNTRFPGQYFDQETGLHYNYFRYYDPSTGRYITSDPIGIVGGINTYSYVGANPVLYTDPNGLKTYRCTKPLDAVTKKYGKGVSKWAHDNVPAAYHQYSCVVDASGTTCGGQDRGEKDKDGKRKGKKSRDNKDAGECEETQPDNKCFEDCLKKKWEGSRPNYGIPFGTDCQEYDDNVNQTCRTECGL